MTEWDYVVAYTGTVRANSAEDAEQVAVDLHLLAADLTVTVYERGGDDAADTARD